MVDLHAQQAVTDARMSEDQLRAERARQRPHAARSSQARTSWPELLERLRTRRREARLRKAA